MLRIIVEEFCNDKSNLFCCFVDFRKAFNTVPRNHLWNRLEELNVPFELRATAIKLYENVNANFKSNEEWSKDIKRKSDLNKVSPSPLPYLAFTSTS